MTKSKKKKFRWWKVPIAIVAVILCLGIVYAAYVFISYNRIADNTPASVAGSAANDSYKVGEEYTAMCYNIGFGAYTPDFTFFMDGGTQSWANSKESVLNCTNGDIDLIKAYNADIVCIQEVDTDSTRSYHVNQADMIREAFPDDSSAFAVNFHSPFLFYPFTQPHGTSNSGLLTLSSAQITDSLRRSLPIADSVAKLVDLDRCYSFSRVKVENGKELVVFNAHLSAYGTNGDLQTQQLSMLFNDMKAEYDKGNYVLCGADYNHDFTGNSKEYFNENPKDQPWASAFPDDLIPAHFSKATDYASGMTTPTCRDCDVPYTANHSGKTYDLKTDGSYDPACFTVILDGFIVSDNIETTFVDVVNNEFLYSDHNPVVMKFKLK